MEVAALPLRLAFAMATVVFAMQLEACGAATGTSSEPVVAATQAPTPLATPTAAPPTTVETLLSDLEPLTVSLGVLVAECPGKGEVLSGANQCDLTSLEFTSGVLDKDMSGLPTQASGPVVEQARSESNTADDILFQFKGANSAADIAAATARARALFDDINRTLHLGQAPAVPLPTAIPSPTPPPTPTPAPPDFVYEIDGTGTATVTYFIGPGSSEQQEANVTLPWMKQFHYWEEPQTPVLSAQHTSAGSAPISCTILSQGGVIAHAESNGQYAVVQCSPSH